jgi:excinuclease ABC subunit A
MGVLYICDEPTIGLHPVDNDRLIRTLERLRDLGNTVLVVEHDEAMMRPPTGPHRHRPGAGEHGGRGRRRGRRREVMRRKSHHRRLPLGGGAHPVPEERRAGNGERSSSGRAREQPQEHRRGFPLGTFIAVTGVSGSGKSRWSPRSSTAPRRTSSTARASARASTMPSRASSTSTRSSISTSRRSAARRARTRRPTPACSRIIRDLFAACPRRGARLQARGASPST